MFGLVLFDFDGVLVISNDAHIDVCQRALKKAGIDREINPDEITDHFGKSYEDVLKAIMGEDYSPERFDIGYKEQRKLLYSDSFFKNVRRISGVREFLLGLRKKGIKLALASGNERAFLDKALRLLELDNVFDLILSAEDVSNSKPDPEMVFRAMEKFGVRPEETLFVGDAKNDVLAAKGANARSAVVLTGVLDREEAKKLKPDFILEDVFGVRSLVA
jgi:pyrophosphatase PpaX